MQKNVAIQFNNVEIIQNNISILRNVTFTIYKGDFVYLFGGTGSGKSSLIKSIQAGVSISGGQASVEGIILNKIPSEEIPFLRRRLGIVSHDIPLSPFLSVEENLLLVLQATGWDDRKQQQHRLAQVYQLMRIERLRACKISQLTQKEYVQVLFARAILNQPQLLILDAPTQNLDARSAREVLTFMHGYAKDNESTVLFATSDKNIPQKFPGDSILMCQNGTLSELEHAKS